LSQTEVITLTKQINKDARKLEPVICGVRCIKLTIQGSDIMKIRAFVFDDNKQVREIISELLKSKGYEVYSFSEPGICPILLNQNCPCPLEHVCTDFIITDLNMPNMTGLELIKNQKDYGCKTEHIAILSGAWSESELKVAKDLNCKTFNKPMQVQELYSWLDECEKKMNPDRILSDWFKDQKEIKSFT